MPHFTKKLVWLLCAEELSLSIEASKKNRNSLPADQSNASCSYDTTPEGLVNLLYHDLRGISRRFLVV